MILGVVLGNIAEVNLSRALAISDDVTLFLTRPWSLFFIIVGVFSAVFPWYQKFEGQRRWTLVFMPLLCIAVTGPMFLMEGWLRPAIGVALLVFGVFMMWRRARHGWQLEPSAKPPAQ